MGIEMSPLFIFQEHGVDQRYPAHLFFLFPLLSCGSGYSMVWQHFLAFYPLGIISLTILSRSWDTLKNCFGFLFFSFAFTFCMAGL